MSTEITVLIVDDDEDIRDMLTEYLADHDYKVLVAKDGVEMRERLNEHAPHVVLLDIGLPGEDGLSLARYIRETVDIGIIIVSGARETVDRIVGLEVGADDYLAKPFDLRELRARLKSVLRRYARSETAAESAVPETAATKRVGIGATVLDLDSCQLFNASGEEVSITAAEFELLKVFAERPNRPLSRDQLMSLTQGRDWDPYDRSIDIRIARLRKKIEVDADKPQAIKTKRGIGYMFVPPKTTT